MKQALKSRLTAFYLLYMVSGLLSLSDRFVGYRGENPPRLRLKTEAASIQQPLACVCDIETGICR